MQDTWIRCNQPVRIADKFCILRSMLSTPLSSRRGEFTSIERDRHEAHHHICRCCGRRHSGIDRLCREGESRLPGEAKASLLAGHALSPIPAVGRSLGESAYDGLCWRRGPIWGSRWIPPSPTQRMISSATLARWRPPIARWSSALLPPAAARPRCHPDRNYAMIDTTPSTAPTRRSLRMGVRCCSMRPRLPFLAGYASAAMS